MKMSLRILTVGLAAAVVLSVGSAAVYASDLREESSGVLADADYTLEEMLQYAIQDEYAAKAEYTAIINVYGNNAPFVNIEKAEENHIARLTELFEAYGYSVPAEETLKETVLPDSLEKAYATGVSAEENNIAMYERFLKEALPADVKLVFERLRKASEKHLIAFQNAVVGNLPSCPGGQGGNRMRGNFGFNGNGTCNPGIGQRGMGRRGTGCKIS